jgi:uncharacterized protein (DUF1778 family)
MHRFLRPLALVAAALVLAACQLPVTAQFNSPLDKQSPNASGTDDLTAFALTIPPGNGQPGGSAPGVITGTSVAVTIPFGVSPAALVATFTTNGAQVSIGSTPQVSGTTANNFSQPLVYTVTAVNGAHKDYTVTVTVAASSTKDITSFVVSGGSAAVISSAGGTTGTISLTVPAGTSLTNLAPVIQTNGVSVSPASGTARDFSNSSAVPLTYTVTAADTSTKVYSVTITQAAAASSTKDITSFVVSGGSAAVISSAGGTTGTISLTVPAGTSLTNLAPVIQTNGVSVSPASGTARDFSNSSAVPLTYTVTAADNSTKVYSVTITQAGAASSAKNITAFTVGSAIETIDDVAGTVTLTVPYGTDVTALAPTISVSAGASISPASGVARNFTLARSYTVTAADNSAKTYQVTITVAPQPVFTSFTIGTVTVDVTALTSTDFIVSLPSAADFSTTLKPTFTTSPGATVWVGSTQQTSGVTAKNFTSAITYTVKDPYGSAPTSYTVTVSTPTGVGTTLPPATPTVTVTPTGFSLGSTFTVTGGASGSLTATCSDTNATFAGWYKDGTLDGANTFASGYPVAQGGFAPGFHSVTAVFRSGNQNVSTTVYFKTN